MLIKLTLGGWENILTLLSTAAKNGLILYFSKSRGGVQKKFGEENRHFESWRGGKKSTPWPEYIPLE